MYSPSLFLFLSINPTNIDFFLLTQGGGRSLREDEEAFLREERLKDDLDLSRRQKLELEAALLDRDARAIESKFDLGMSFRCCDIVA